MDMKQIACLLLSSCVLLCASFTGLFEETAREAFHHGYKTTLVADGVSSYMPDLHAATIKNFAMKFGWVNNTDDILKQLASRLNSK